MLRQKTIQLLIAAFLVAVAVAVLAYEVPQVVPVPLSWQTGHNRIRELQDLPPGPVRISGVVTYVDENGKKFWIQDETGALSIDVDPRSAKVAFGALVRIRAIKTHTYDPQIGYASIALKDLRVETIRSDAELPSPAPVSTTTLPEKEKNGIRVTVDGVLRRVDRNNDGLTYLDFGTDQDISAVLPGDATYMKNWIDATVRITGVSDVALDEGGSSTQARKRIWVQRSGDIQKIQNAPEQAPLYSIRDLYQKRKQLRGHLVRMRGRSVAVERGAWLQFEDQWGLARCRSGASVSIPPGTSVEVAGFPLGNGLRIDLSHCRVTALDAASIPSSQVESPQRTTVAAIKRLSEQEAEAALPVEVSGVLTYVDTDWRQAFLQDSTGGIFVKYAGGTIPLHKGDRVTVIGLTDPGDYAPVIVAAKFANLQKAKTPDPMPLSTRALTGAMDSLFVEVKGVVHPLKPRQNPKHVVLELYTWLGPIKVILSPAFAGPESIADLEGATVSVRGVCGEIFNSRRQLINIQLAVSDPKDLELVGKQDDLPFSNRSVDIAKLSRFSPDAIYGGRVKVSGSVTMLGSDFFYIQDRTGGVRVEGDTTGLRLADLVDVAGYVTPAGYSPGLTDAVVQVRKNDTPTAVQAISLDSASAGDCDAKLVSVKGTLLGILSSTNSRTLVMRSEGQNFDAALYLGGNQNVPELQEGSILRLTGICTVELARSTAYMLNTKDPVSLKLVIRSLDDIEVLKQASWWNVRHTTGIVAALVVGITLCFGWVTILRRRVQTQRAALQKAKEKTDAFRGLIGVIQDVTRNKQFTSRVPVRGGDEIAQLSAEFNQMLHELQLREFAKSRAESQLQQQALTDELTGLPNRRLLADRLSQVLEMAKRDSRTLALLYLDLDGFKLVNDSLGHTVGDMLLGQVADRLRSRIRKSDTLARLGGDEFTVILTTLHSKEDAELVANNLLQVLTAPFQIEGHEITISASIGISVFPENGTDANQLLQEADSAMYAAKRNGKNRVMYFTPELGSSVRERLNLENQLRAAIAKEEIQVHYQPEFDVATRQLVRFEALARWVHPTLGNITPDKFIPIAEESGLIIPLGAFVLERACCEAATWQKLSDHPIQVAVNVSTVQFRRESFVDEVSAALTLSGLSPKLLQIELTESITLDGTERAASTMKRLSQMGVSIAVDDFGTGYSCFSYLPRLPFNTLKIDRTFVRELDNRPEMKAMVQSLVNLAHNLNMQVVVEGIETVQQLETVEILGGNQVQGFLLGRPTPDPKSILASVGTLALRDAKLSDSPLTKSQQLEANTAAGR